MRDPLTATSGAGHRETRDGLNTCTHSVQVLTCSTADSLAGRQLFFKCEIFQKRCGGRRPDPGGRKLPFTLKTLALKSYARRLCSYRGRSCSLLHEPRAI